MRAKDYIGKELFGYAPGHDGPFKVGAALEGDEVRFTDGSGCTILLVPAEAEPAAYEALGIGLHGWTIWTGGSPTICVGDAVEAAAVSRFAAGLTGRRGVYVRQSVTEGDFAEPVGPYREQIVSVVEADPAQKPGLYAVVDADGETVEHICSGARPDPSGEPIVQILRRDSSIFWHAATLLFPEADGFPPQKTPPAGS